MMVFPFIEHLRYRRRLRKTVGRNVSVGSGFNCGNGSYLWAPRQLTLGNNVSVGSNVRIEVDGVIGDAVLIANSAAIVGRADHAIEEVGVPIRDAAWVGTNPDQQSRPVVIGSDIWIGYGATITSGVTLGDGCIVGAGSVVTRDIPQNAIVAGNPAKIVRMRFDQTDADRHWELLLSKGIRKIT